MFTDIEGYTALMQKDEASAVLWLEKHRKYFETCMLKFEGEIIQYYGDGSLSIFNSALFAVKSAIELQTLWQQETDLPVRIGMHVGEIILHEDGIIGDAVNIASRIESLASAGSILISGRVREELKNQKDIETHWFGSFEFKNVEEPIEVYSIKAPGIITPEAPHHQAKLKEKNYENNFPNYSNEFLGRKTEFQELKNLLLQSSYRLITILGAGGLGKTRLAVETGRNLTSEFREGSCYIALDGIDTNADIYKNIGTVLGLREQDKADWRTKVLGFLKPANILLILDNFEHLLKSKNIIHEILDNSPYLRILITSRSNLNLAEEREYHLPPLEVPDHKYSSDPAKIIKNESVALFIQKARQVKQNFVLDKNNTDSIIRICRELEGVPLAIELAASRIKIFSPSQILHRLEDLFSLLKTSRSVYQKRHQAIQETIRWSYDLLTEEDKRVFRCFSIFRVGFSLDAAQALVPEIDAIDAIESLLNNSLLRIDESNSTETRFAMLRVIREFGQEELFLQPKEHKNVEAAYAQFYLNFIQANQYQREAGKASLWLNLIHQEIEHIRYVSQYYIRTSAKELRFFLLLHWRYYLLKGFLKEGYELTRHALSSYGEIVDELQGKLLIASGSFAQNLGSFRDARDLFSHALSIFIKVNNSEQTCITLNNLAWVEFRLGNFDKSDSYSEHALQLAKNLNLVQHEAKALNNYAWVAKFRGHLDEALEFFNQIYRINLEYKNEHGIAFSAINKGWTLHDLGNDRDAENYISEAIRFFESEGDLQLLSFSKLIQSSLMENRAEILIEEVIPSFTEIGDSWGLGLSNFLVASYYFEQNELEKAEKYLHISLQIRSSIDDRWGICQCHLTKAMMFVQNKNYFEAYRHLNHARVLGEQMNATGLLCEIISLQAWLDYQEGKTDESAKKFGRVLQLAKKISKNKRGEILKKYQFYYQNFNLHLESDMNNHSQ